MCNLKRCTICALCCCCCCCFQRRLPETTIWRVVTSLAFSQSRLSSSLVVLEEVSGLFGSRADHVATQGNFSALSSSLKTTTNTLLVSFPVYVLRCCVREMSAGSQTTRSLEIPAIRRVAIHDAAHMPQEYSTTPGGTVFSTTPGGNRELFHANNRIVESD